MAKNYFNRYIWLIELINEHGYIKFNDISDAWSRSYLNSTESASLQESKLPQRTFFNHIEAIYDIFGIEIKCDRYKGYYIATSEDIEADGAKKWLLELLSLNNLLNESKGIRDRILFEEVPSSQRWLSVLVRAIKIMKTVRITYQGFDSANPSTFEMNPWCIKLFKQRWYLIGNSEGYKEPRVYSLDRIYSVIETDNKIKIPKKFNASEFFRHSYGIFIDGRKPETIRLKVDNDQIKYFESLPLHHSQKIIEKTETYSIFEYYLVPTYDFIQEILSKGKTVEVLSPESLRDEIHGEALAMLARYEQN